MIENKSLKVFFLSVLCLFSTVFVFSQKTPIDDIQGFQDFHFNTAPGNYEKYKMQKTGENTFLIKEPVHQIYNFDIEQIELVFVNNELRSIQLFIDDQDRKKNAVIFNALKDKYGRFHEKQHQSGMAFVSQLIWTGKKVKLIYTLKTYREGDGVRTKIIISYSYLYNPKEIDVSSDI
jgi:hypothetical protein